MQRSIRGFSLRWSLTFLPVVAAMAAALSASPRLWPWLERFVTWAKLTRVSENVVFFEQMNKREVDLGQIQYLYYVSLVAAAVVGALVASAIDHWGLERLPRFRAPIRGFVAIAAVILLVAKYGFFGKVVTVCAVLASFLMASHGAVTKRETDHGSVVAVVASSIVLAWSAWVFGAAERSFVPIVGALIAVLAGGAIVASRNARAASPALFPIALLPFASMMRGASLAWPATVLFAGVILCHLANTRWPKIADVSVRVAPYVGPWAVALTMLLPAKFRELPGINHHVHEGIHLGWMNSVSFGKFMMADAGHSYGPLREYALAGIGALFGFTLSGIRIAHVLLNVTGLLLMILAGYWAARRSAILTAFFALAVLVATHVGLYVSYWESLSFGWVDLARQGIASVGLLGAVAAIHRNRSWKTCASWGLVSGASLIYSQDFGLASTVSVVMASCVDGAMAIRRPWPSRTRVYSVLAYVVGALIPVCGVFLIYGLFGKARLLADTIATFTGLLAAGAWSAYEYPIKRETFASLDALTAAAGAGGHLIEYLFPPTLILIGAILVIHCVVRRRQWSERTMLVLALTLFSLVSFRHGLLRSEIFHLRSCGTPSLLLGFVLLSDATSRLRLKVRGHLLPVGACLTLFFFWDLYSLANLFRPLDARIERILQKVERPSLQEATYQYADIPRSGDVLIPSEVLAAVRYVRARTTREYDTVLCTVDFIQGGEYAFLLNRKNPTRFDVAHELITKQHQAEMEAVFLNHPPSFIVGGFFNYYSDATKRTIEQKYVVENVPGASVPIRRLR